MSNQVPQRLTNFNIYNVGNRLMGVATVDLPELAYMTDTISGAGIAGEVDSIVKGHFQSMTTTINWRTVEKGAAVLSAPRMHTLTLRGSQEVYNRQSGIKESKPLVVEMNVEPKNTTLGSAEVGAQTGSSNEFEVTYVKVIIEGETVIEIDKFNFICFINGVDYLADIRDQT